MAWIFGVVHDVFQRKRESYNLNDEVPLSFTFSSERQVQETALHSTQLTTVTPSNARSLHENNLLTTEESHSELGAARSVLQNTWHQLQVDRIRLPTEQSSHSRSWLDRLQRTLKFTVSRSYLIWKIFLQQPADFVFSFCLAAILIAIFVIESSGVILSAEILSDTITLASSPNCSITSLFYFDDEADQARRALAYSKQCYAPGDNTDRCNYFFNRSITYTEKSNDTCPFSGGVCIGGDHAAYTLDTGIVDAKYLGINTHDHYYFRRRTTCTPVMEYPSAHKDDAIQNIPPDVIGDDIPINLVGWGLSLAGYVIPFYICIRLYTLKCFSLNQH